MIDPWQGRYAGIVSRAGAFAIDVIVVTIATSGTIFFLQALDAMLRSEPLGNVQIAPEWAALISIFIFLVYFVGGWTVFGRTGGEALFGLRVVRRNGTRVHVLRCLLRFFVFFPSLLLMGVGVLWILVDKRRRTWADIAARTVVVYDWGTLPDLGTSSVGPGAIDPVR